MVTYPSSWFVCIKLHTTKYFFLIFDYDLYGTNDCYFRSVCANSPLSIPSDRTTLFYGDPSESTVATYISIFETLWMQSELQELM
jgi:hypothetical protein